MQIGPKYKICRRLGSGIFEKCQTHKFVLSESRKQKQQRSGRRPRALSDFGKQLLEKQRARFSYGITEKQLAKYVKGISMKSDADPTTQLMHSLELRLDNVVYRAGLAATRRHARQLVSHGHVTVNGRKIDVPSHHMQEGDTFAVREGSRDKGPFSDQKEAERRTPAWITFDAQTLAGKLAAMPAREDVETIFDPALVLEFYSR